jgi:hypothetical protein
VTAPMQGRALPPKWTGKFTKRPVTVEAVQLIDDLRNHTEIAAWIEANGGHAEIPFTEPCLYIETLEGRMRAGLGDWIVKGIDGEFHPVRGDIFARSYDPADGLEGKTPGRAVYEAQHAAQRQCFPGIAPIAWDELSVEAQAESEGIARAGIAAYIEANGRDPVDAASVIAEAVVPEMAAAVRQSRVRGEVLTEVFAWLENPALKRPRPADLEDWRKRAEMPS